MLIIFGKEYSLYTSNKVKVYVVIYSGGHQRSYPRPYLLQENNIDHLKTISTVRFLPRICFVFSQFVVKSMLNSNKERKNVLSQNHKQANISSGSHFI